ncbi:MAG: NHL repeat-containing protein [Chloroflexi bacterium]|nr:NHL repeat-containing protein [Chloroflexota bacterium]MCL5274401.1 NHL repeat-containing protein [Chloroflexota bacterium]
MSETGKVETFQCPNCGAPIEHDGKGERTVKCSFCGTAATVPPELLPPTPITIAPIYTQTYAPTFTPTEDKVVKATVATGAGCVLGSVLLPIIIVAVTGVIIYAVFSGVMGQVQTVTSSFTNDIKVPAAVNTVRAPTRTPTRTPTPAPSPTPSYATKVLSFGGKGTGTGKFIDARYVGVDGKGNIYAAEYSGGRVQVFDGKGNYLAQWRAGNSKTLILGFAVDLKGAVYVADGAVITHYDGMTGDKLGVLNYPGGPGFGELATTPDGGLVAMWYQRREGLFTSVDGAREDLVRFDAKGKVVLVISGPISTQTEDVSLDNLPLVDGKNDIYIISSNEAAIFSFTSEGKYVNRFGSSGSDPGQIYSPRGFAADSQGNLYVSDSDGISIFQPDGRFVRRFKEGGSSFTIAFDNQDNLYTVNGTTITEYTLGQ